MNVHGLTLIVLFIVTNSIKIPFKKEKMEYLDNLYPFIEMISNYMVVEISIGSPPQKFKVNIEFFGSSLWLMAPNCEDLVNYQTSSQMPFQYEKSSSYKKHPNNEMYTFNTNRYIKAYRAIDKLKIENISINKYDFFMTTRFTDLSINSGILGLDITDAKYGDIKENGFLAQLKVNNVINKKVFYFDFDKENKNNGNLVIGEVPIEDKNHKYVKDSIKDSRWILRFDSVIYGKDKIILPMQTVRFKIELGIIVGPESYLNFILNDFFDEYIKKTLCDYKEVIGSNFNMFTCKESIVDTYFYDSFPKLEFFFRGKSIVFISRELFVKNNIGEIAFIIYFSKTSSIFSKNEWTVGEQFLRKTTFIFDADDQTVVIYYTIENNTNNFILYFVISLLITSIVLYVIYKVLYKRRAHRRKKENRTKGLLPQEENDIELQ